MSLLGCLNQGDRFVDERVERILVVAEVQDVLDSLSLQDHASDFACQLLRWILLLSSSQNKLVEVISDKLLFVLLCRTGFELVHWDGDQRSWGWFFLGRFEWNWWRWLQ